MFLNSGKIWRTIQIYSYHSSWKSVAEVMVMPFIIGNTPNILASFTKDMTCSDDNPRGEMIIYSCSEVHDAVRREARHDFCK